MSEQNQKDLLEQLQKGIINLDKVQEFLPARFAAANERYYI